MNTIKSLLAKLLGISKSVLDFLIPIAKDQIGNSLEKLLPIALAIVTELATGNLNNSAKKTAAIKKLGDAATAEGISAGLSVLNLAVEIAVSNLKASTPSK